MLSFMTKRRCSREVWASEERALRSSLGCVCCGEDERFFVGGEQYHGRVRAYCCSLPELDWARRLSRPIAAKGVRWSEL